MNPCKRGAAQFGADNNNARNNNLRQNNNNKKARKNLQGGGLKLAPLPRPLNPTPPSSSSRWLQHHLLPRQTRRRTRTDPAAKAKKSLSRRISESCCQQAAFRLANANTPTLLALPPILSPLVGALYIAYREKTSRQSAHDICVCRFGFASSPNNSKYTNLEEHLYGLLLIRPLMAPCPQISKSTTCVVIRWESHHDYSKFWDLVWCSEFPYAGTHPKTRSILNVFAMTNKALFHCAKRAHTEVWARWPLSFVNRTLLIYGLVASGATRRRSTCWPALRWLGGSVDMTGTVCSLSEYPGYLRCNSGFNTPSHVLCDARRMYFVENDGLHIAMVGW
jgi:hypothetical protein